MDAKTATLLGDIGGTNFKLRLTLNKLTVYEKVYESKGCTSFKEYIDRFLSEAKYTSLRLHFIVLAIRGTVINGECKTDFAGESEIRLSQHYNDCKVKFINDAKNIYREWHMVYISKETSLIS